MEEVSAQPLFWPSLLQAEIQGARRERWVGVTPPGAVTVCPQGQAVQSHSAMDLAYFVRLFGQGAAAR